MPDIQASIIKRAPGTVLVARLQRVFVPPVNIKVLSHNGRVLRLSTKPLFSKGDRGFVMPKSGYIEEGKNPSGHNQPFNVLSSGGQEALFPHVLNSKHTGKT